MHNGTKPRQNDRVPTTDRLPPYSQEAEEALLGGLLIDNEAIYEVLDIITPAHFYTGRARSVYKAMARLNEAGPLDLVTVADALRADWGFDAPPEEYLADLVTAVPTALNTRRYGELVRDYYQRRQMIQESGRLATAAYDLEMPPGKALEEAERAFFRLAEEAESRTAATASQLARDHIDATEKRQELGLGMVGLPTGLLDLDRMLKGLRPANMVTVAGRPGMGKTSLATTAMLHQAAAGYPVAMFNMEMSREQLATRLIGNLARVDTERIATGSMNKTEYGRYLEAAGRFSRLPIFIDDTAALTPTQLRAKVRRLYMEHGVAAVWVDFLQLMNTERDYQNDNSRIAYISRSIKALALDLEIPLCVLSQLNRGVEQRADKRPLLSDLRDSGTIEQDSDVVIMLYCDDYYNPETAEDNKAEVIIRKNRHGRGGTADLHYWKEYTRFDNRMTQEVSL